MKSEVRFFDKDWISTEIICYLMAHPHAGDSLEGIMEWWLLERKIIYQINLVREVLEELVAKGLLLKDEAGRGPNYRLNSDKMESLKGSQTGED